MATSLQGLPAMRTDFPVVPRWLVAMWTDAAGCRFENIGEVIARDGVDEQSNQQ